MSNLPVVDQQAISQRLMVKLSELMYQNTQLELLAEALRDARDVAISERDSFAHQLNTSRQVDDPTS